MRLALNIAVFYAGWFGSVMAAAAGRDWLALAAALAVVLVHLVVTPRPFAELKLIIAAAVIGLVAEGMLITFGFASYTMPNSFAVLPPLWLVAIWMAFATTMNVSLGWLKNHVPLSAVLGFLMAPPSYFAGQKLGGIVLAEPHVISLAAIGLVWAGAFPLLVVLARRWDGAGSQRAKS